MWVDIIFKDTFLNYDIYDLKKKFTKKNKLASSISELLEINNQLYFNILKLVNRRVHLLEEYTQIKDHLRQYMKDLETLSLIRFQIQKNRREYSKFQLEIEK